MYMVVTLDGGHELHPVRDKEVRYRVRTPIGSNIVGVFEAVAATQPFLSRS